jgi:hypothetical protein
MSLFSAITESYFYNKVNLKCGKIQDNMTVEDNGETNVGG